MPVTFLAMASILIIDDDTSFCYVLTRTVQSMAHTALCCHSLAEAETLLHTTAFDVILLDVCLPDGNGLAGIDLLARHPSHPAIIVMTGLGVPEDAEKAILNGAWDYIQKTSSPRKIAQTLEQVLRYRDERQNRPLLAARAVLREHIVGESPQLLQCLESMGIMARGESNILLYGETGTGKEAFARAIHANSARRHQPFVVVDCASLPDTLVESLLFGHARGAFTGAERERTGLIHQADKGTLFLDEVGELPEQIQGTFLRVLQEHAYRPVGSLHEERSDFRVVAATNRDLDLMAREGLFRKDLLFRLRGAQLSLPSLKERTGDVTRIAEYSIRESCTALRVPCKNTSPEFMETLNDYPWPGNVRELINAIEYAVNAACYETSLFHVHLPQALRAWVARHRLQAAPPTLPEKQAPPGQTAEGLSPLPHVLPPLADFREQVVQQAERHYLEQLLLRSHADLTVACAVSGVSISRLYALLKKNNLPAHPRGMDGC